MSTASTTVEAIVALGHRGGRAPWWRAARRRVLERGAWAITLGSALAVVGITAGLVVQLYANSSVARHQFGLGFLRASTWDPVNGDFGALPFIFGTVVTTAVALAIAVPAGLGCAIFLAELAPRRVSNGLTFLIELLVAVPSVIYGLLAIFVLVPLMTRAVAPRCGTCWGGRRSSPGRSTASACCRRPWCWRS